MTDDYEMEIRSTLMARNALRKEAQLPLLDIEAELEKTRIAAAAAAANDRYHALCKRYAQERRKIRMEIIDKARAAGNTTYPNGYFGNYQLHTLVEQQFQVFLDNRPSEDAEANEQSTA